jgi:AcrR family transcriptional regulator
VSENLKDTLNDDKRDALLDAARHLFLKNTYANISIRKIADKAKVNSAMIAYYFGSKSGLFREMLKSFVEENIHRGMASVDEMSETSLQGFLVNFYRSVPTELTQLVIRTMLYERSDMRDWLLETLMKPAFETALKVSEKIIDHKGKSVDPLILRTTLQAMLIAPKLLQPILTELHPDEINPEFYDRLAMFQAELVSTFFELEKN